MTHDYIINRTLETNIVIITVLVLSVNTTHNAKEFSLNRVHLHSEAINSLVNAESLSNILHKSCLCVYTSKILPSYTSGTLLRCTTRAKIQSPVVLCRFTAHMKRLNGACILESKNSLLSTYLMHNFAKGFLKFTMNSG